MIVFIRIGKKKGKKEKKKRNKLHHQFLHQMFLVEVSEMGLFFPFVLGDF